MKFRSCDFLYRLWTIGDALDGEILVKDNCPFIYRIGEDGEEAHAYGGVTVGGFFVVCDKEDIFCEKDKVKPATGKQADYLYAKMTEKKLGWDAKGKKIVNI